MSVVRHIRAQTVLCTFLLPLVVLAVGPTLAQAAAATTTTTLAITSTTGAVASVSVGTAVTLTATVKAGSAIVPAGLVKFCDAAAAHCTDIHLIGMGQLGTSGTAALKFIPGPGVHSYKVEFGGTTTDAVSSSAASSLTVNGAPTTTTIAQSGAVGGYTLKAIVTGKGSLTGPTGKVSFLDTSNANAVLGTATLGASSEAFAWTTSQSPTTAAEPQSIVAADFNGDGIPDLGIGTNGTSATKNIGAIDILLGKGDGTFQAAKSYAGLAGNQLIVAAPFVTGGPQDILAANNSTATTGNGLLFLGDGKGGLGTGTTLSLGIYTITAIITGDFNGDGKTDFVVAGQAFGVPAFNVFLGNGNGTFNSGTLNATSDVPITALGAGDFTGQGALDIAVVHSDGTIDIFLQDGAGDFYPNAGTQAGSSPTAIAIGDLNGDGNADLAITDSTQGNISILLGKGDGTFTAIASPPTGSDPKAIAVGDFNADGIVDLAVANSSAETVTILLGKGDGTFTAEPVLDTGNTPVSLVIGKFNGQGTADIAIANEAPASSTSTATIFLSQLTEAATAAATGIAPVSAGTHLVDASYPGDTIWQAGVSSTTSLSGSAKQAVAPILSPAAGTYATAQTITLTDTTPGAVLYYSTNGTTPTTASTRYTAPFKVAATETIEAIATASGYSQSIVASAKYTIETPTLTMGLSPSSLTFPATTVGTQSAVQVVTVKNTGADALTLSGISVSAPFVRSSYTCSTTLVAGASCTVSIAYKPTAATTSTGTLVISSNGTSTPASVTLTGTGTSASSGLSMSLAPTSLAFGNEAVGSTSAVQVVTVKNTGTGALTLSGISVSAPFVRSSYTCSTTLVAGASCTVSIAYKPTAATTSTGTLVISSNGTSTPASVTLTGTGTSASSGLSMSLAPTSLAFGNEAVGSTSAVQVVTVKNTGTGALTLSGISVSAPFVRSSYTCSTTLVAGASCTVSIAYKPTAATTSTGTLVISSNGTSTPASVTLTGTGTSSTSSLTVTPSSLAFESVAAGSTTAAQVVTIKNTSTASIGITSLIVSAPFVRSAYTCASTLVAGGSCAVSIEYKPITTGNSTANLVIGNGVAGTSTAVMLTGLCGDPTSIAPDAYTYIFNTSLGNIYVELRPDAAPKNVANFLNYVNNGTYTNSIIHRVVAGFINQGGGYKLNSSGEIIAPTTGATVVNEFKLSNVRGTIAMAKLSNDPNSATDQFFFNAADDSSILDGQDGGYTVIGQIVGVQGVGLADASEGLAVMDAINATPTFAFQSPFDSIPLLNYSEGTAVEPSNYVYINSISKVTAKTDGPATPIFTPVGGTYAGPQTVTLTDSTPGATIYYYLFAGTPKIVTQYTGPFTISSSQYVVAYATAPGYSSQSYNNYEYFIIQ